MKLEGKDVKKGDHIKIWINGCWVHGIYIDNKRIYYFNEFMSYAVEF